MEDVDDVEVDVAALASKRARPLQPPPDSDADATADAFNHWNEDDPQEMKDGYRALIPLDRWGVPADMIRVLPSLYIDLERYAPDVVLVCVGTNNAWSWRADGGTVEA